MKILWTVSNWKHTGPLEPSLDLAAAVRGMGHRVLVAVGRPPRGRAAEAVACARERGLDLADTGARLAKHSAPLRDRSDAMRLKRFLYAVRPDLAVATQRNDHRLLLRAARGKASVPVARLFFDDGRGALDRRDLAALRASTDIFVFSDAAHRRLLDAGVSAGRIARTGPPLDLRTLRSRAGAAQATRSRLGVEPGRFLFGIVARLQPHRRFDLLWEAMQGLRKEGLDVHLLVVGRGTHQEAVARRPIAQRGLADCVTLTGYLRGDDYASTLGALDAQVFLVPGSDPTCRALREGMALGVPSIATRLGMLPEIVNDGETGLLCDESAAALAASMRALATDPERARLLGNAARARATRVFDAQRVAADLLATFRGRGWDGA